MGTVNENLAVTLTLNNRPFTHSAEEAERVTKRLEDRLDAAGKHAEKLEGSFGKAASAVKSFGGAADSVRNIERHVTSLTSRIRDMVVIAGMFRFAMADLNDVFISLPKSILKTSGEFERLSKMLEGLSQAPTELERIAEASKGVQNIFKLAQNAPFEASALTDAYVKLRVAGVKPLESSMNSLVDAVAKTGGSGEQLKRASVAIQQMVGKGAVSMEELRQQLGEAVPTAMRAMAVGMKMSMAELMNVIKTGTVQAEGAIQRMLFVLGSESAGSASKMMDTYVGQVAKLTTNWQLFQVAAGDAGFLSAARDILKDINDQFASPEGRAFSKSLGEGLATTVRSLAISAKEVVKYFDEIKMLATWFLASFIVSRVAPVWEAMIAGQQKYATGMAATTAANLASDKAAMAGSLAFNMQTNQARLASLQYTLNQSLALEARHRIQAQLLDRRVSEIYNSGKPVSTSADMARVRQTIVAQGELAAAQKLTTAALRENIAVTAQSIVADKAQVAGIQAGTVAYMAKAGAMTRVAGLMAGMGRLALAATGGWIGMITLGLWAGVTAWDAWGNKGAKELARIKDIINSKTAERKDLTAAQSQIDDAAAAEKAQRDIVNRATTNRTNPNAAVQTQVSDAAFRKMNEDLRKLEAVTSEAKRRRAEVGQIVTDNEGEAIARKIATDTAKSVQAIEDGVNRKTGALRDAAEKEIKEGNLKGKQLTAAQNKLARDELAMRAESFKTVEVEQKRQLAALDANGKELAKRRGTGSDTLVDGQIKANNIARAQKLADLLATQDKVRQGIDYMANDSPLNEKEKKAKGPGGATSDNDPLNNLLIESKAKLDAARIRLDGIGDGIKSFAVEKAAIQAVLEGEFKEGKFDKTVKGKKGKVPMSRKEFDEKSPNIADAQAKEKMVAEERTITARATRELANATEDAAREQAHLNDGLEKSKSPLEAAREVFAKLGVEIDKTKESTIKFDEIREKVFSQRVSEGVSKWASDAQKKTKDDNAASLNAIDRAKEEFGEKSRLIDSIAEARRREVSESTKSEEEKARLFATINETTERQQLAASKRQSFETRTSFEVLLEDWTNVQKRMEDAKAQWAQAFSNTFVEGIKKGKFEWASLVEDILASLLKIQLEKQITATIGSATGKEGGGWFESLVKMGVAAYTGGASEGAGYDSAVVTAQSTQFAKGGIMTDRGSMPLRMYAKGGIANSPQLAMYGEGSLPEAYVPLPDGRSIPVTMQGGGGGAMPDVTVNVINQSGTQVGAQKGQPRFDGKQMILDVVLTAVSSPGAFRDGMKGAIKQ